MHHIQSVAPFVAALFGIYLTQRYDYLLFHSLAEAFSIVIAFGIFMITWNTRRFLQNHYLLFVGISYFYVGFIDLLHTLAFKGMGIFEGFGANLPTQLWIVARYLEAASLLIAMVFLHRKIPARLTFLVYGAVTALLLASIFHWRVFPVCFVEGVGLTPFKIYSEYVIGLILLASIALLVKSSKEFDRNVLILLIGSIATAIAQELAFTTYLSVYGHANLFGHLLKIISFYLLYKAIIEASLISPCNVLFRDLKQSETKFRSIFETNVVPIAYCSIDGRIIDANQTYLELIGASKAELKAGEVRWDTATPPEWKAVDELAIEHLRREGVCPPLEKEYLRRDGTRVPVLLGSCLLPGESEQMVAFALDLTERKQAEQVLVRAKEEWEHTFNSVPDLLAIMDDQHRIIRVNRAMADRLGRTPEQCIGMKCYEVVHRTSQPVENCPYVLTCRDGREHLAEVREPHLGGDFLVSTTPMFDGQGRQTGTVHIARDISDRKRMEEKLRRSKDELEVRVQERTAELQVSNKALKGYAAKLERLNEELRNFAFVAAHDLQEPLRKIQTFCDMAQKRCTPVLDSASRDYLERIFNSASRMRQLLDDLLQFAKLAARPELSKELDLTGLAREAADLFQEAIKETGALVEIETMPTMEGDELQMLRLFQNLIGNALKFHRDETPRIRVYAKQENSEGLEIVVEDNGIGFESHYGELIFKPFQRLHARDAYEGTGMGLAICRKIVEQHGGSIRAESEPGKGSTFIIRLPVRQNNEFMGVS